MDKVKGSTSKKSQNSLNNEEIQISSCWLGLKIPCLLYINLACLSGCYGVCLFVCTQQTSKRLNRSGTNFLWDITWPQGRFMIKISNICLHQNSIFIKFLKILKIQEIFCENPRIMFVLFYDVHIENMFTINSGDGREAPSKASVINIG